MNNKDILQRFLFDNAPVRGELVRLSESYQTILHQHDYPLLIRQLLGEALVVASLLSATIKFKGRLTVQFQGQGKLKLLLAQCNDAFQLRGLVQYQGEFDSVELLEELRKGILVIMIDPDDNVKRYQGIVGWHGNSLAESIEGYFKNSEQLLTRIWIAVSEDAATGLLLQRMPEDQSKTRQDVFPSDDPGWEHLVHLTDTIKPKELLTLSNEVILQRLYVQEDVRLFDPSPIIFRCTCSVERSENAIRLLSPEEIEEELRDKQAIVVTCEFCNKEYIFDRVDVAKLMRKDSPPSSDQIQ